MNIGSKITQLQMALLRRGRKVRIDRIQYYSEKKERTGTIYKLRERVWDDEEGKNVTFEYCSSPKQIDVLCTLVNLYKGGG